MFSDLGLILRWWFAIFVLGIIFLPLSRRLFSVFYDKGYFFSKVLGLLFSTYFIWFLGSLKILAFSRYGIFLSILFCFVLNLFVFIKDRQVKKIKQYFSLVFLIEEFIFLACLVCWSFVRSFQPDIQGLEKFMDFGFVNSILRTQYFPPADIWFAGEPINYYYFGHLVAAFLTKLTAIDSAVTYNLMIASLFSFCFTLIFSLTSNITFLYFKEKVKKIPFKLVVFSGLAAGLIACLGANLHPAYYNLKIKVFKQPYCGGSLSYWYPDATRYIGYCPDVNDKTIHEFPSYSFIVSDLHGHVSDLPFVITFLALIYVLLIKIKESKKDPSFSDPINILLSLFLAVMFMTNQWDFPIYLLVLGSVLLAGFGQKYHWKIKKTLRAVFFGFFIIGMSIPFLLPFQLQFKPIVEGIDFVNARSLPHQLLVLWGIFWFFGLSFIVFLFNSKQKLKKLVNPDLFILILLAVSTLLVFIPEIIYVKDIYIASYHRANTMFKLTYQAYVMFSIVLGYVFVRVLSTIKKRFFYYLLLICYSALVAASLVYPNYSIPGYYGKLNPKRYLGLYGMNFLKNISVGDYDLVVWLNNNVTGQPTIVEAAGDSYTNHNRISMATGLPTIEGWLVHEWLWRGSYDEPGKRAEEVKTIYESGNLEQVTSILGKYKVNYVVVGEMEREKYPLLDEEVFPQIGEKVFESEKTKLYKINSEVY